jgi:membrane fusion protein (multidrug efflux system)
MANFRNIFLLFFVLILSVSMLSSCKNNKEDAMKKGAGRPKGLTSEVYVVIPGTFQNDYNTSGSLLPNEEVEVHPEASGRITAISFKEGAYVRKGQALVQLNDADIHAQINKLRAQKQLQNKIIDRQAELLRIGGISRQDFETTQTQIQSIDADIAYQQAQLAKMRVVAPFEGVVGLRSVSVGAIVSPTSVIATLKQVHPLKMDFMVPEQYHGGLQNGKVIFFTVTGQTEPLSGKISAIDPGADMTTRTIKVRALVPNPDRKLVAGSFAHVRIPFESDNNALLIPSQAIIPTTREKKVAIIKNGKANLVTVTLGTRTNDKVEIIQGLQAGDTVILTGLMQVKPGMDVKVSKVRS